MLIRIRIRNRITVRGRPMDFTEVMNCSADPTWDWSEMRGVDVSRDDSRTTDPQ